MMFSERTVIQANMRMILGEKPVYHVSDKLSREDIERALRKAYRRVFRDKLSTNLGKLRDIAGLEDDWNGYGAEAFSLFLLSKVHDIILHLDEQPEIFPTGRKSIQLEYHLPDGSYLEFEVFENKVVAMQVSGTDYDNAKFWKLSCEDTDRIRQIVDDFVNAQ